MGKVSTLLNKRVTIANPDKVWAAVIGAGLALTPIHNQWLTNITTSEEGEVGFFLPAFGMALWLIGSLAFVVWNWERVTWGSRYVTIPLGIIVVAIGLSGIGADSIIGKFAPALMGIAMFSLYLTARVLGRDMFVPLALGAVIASLGIIIHQLVYPGEATGGFIFERNYDVATGFILLGVLLFVGHKWQWGLAVLALIALLMSGSAEAVFVVGVLGIIVLLRRDWGERLFIAGTVVIILVAMAFITDEGRSTHQLTAWATTGDEQYLPDDRNPDGGTALDRRWNAISSEMQDIKPLGAGYNVTDFSSVAMVHNVPLVVVQQLGWGGIAAGIAFLFVSVYCLVRTRWRYVWVAVLALCVFDHYIWTQLGVLWWAIIGASLVASEGDLIFRRETHGK